MSVRTLDGLQDVADKYDHFILDIYGVLHDGIRPFPGTLATLRALQDAGKQICLLSNSPRRAHNTAADLGYMGIERALFEHIVTSGESTHQALANPADDFHRSCGTDCWSIGHYVVEEILYGMKNMRLLDGPEQASFILNAIPGTSPPEVSAFRRNLEIALDKDMPMICANPDLVVHIGEALYECAGTFAKMYEDMGGRVVYHGKPHAPVYERCYDLLGRPDKARICAVGDSLHTDIAGANNFGIDCALNLAGIHREEITPENIAHIDAQPHRPDYLIGGFIW